MSASGRRAGTASLLAAVLMLVVASGIILTRTSSTTSDVIAMSGGWASGTATQLTVSEAHGRPVASATSAPERAGHLTHAPPRLADYQVGHVHGGHATAAPTLSPEPAPPGSRGAPGDPSAFRTTSAGLTRRESINFSSKCPLARQAADDPIVFPRRPGVSHDHDFFGNRSTDAYSTLASLRGAGTTCHIEADRSAYWAPALYDDGVRVKPELAQVYYRAGQKDHRTIEPFPAGLKVIAFDSSRSRWLCLGGPTAETSNTPPTCGAGKYLGIRIVFPDCWDAKYLDVPDHRSHMAYGTYDGCPASHPAPVPQISMDVRYLGSDGGDVVLGAPGHPVEVHGDFFNAWDQETLKRLIRDCINAGAHCAGKPPG
jgi:hypothetical protein